VRGKRGLERAEGALVSRLTLVALGSDFVSGGAESANHPPQGLQSRLEERVSKKRQGHCATASGSYASLHLTRTPVAILVHLPDSLKPLLPLLGRLALVLGAGCSVAASDAPLDLAACERLLG